MVSNPILWSSSHADTAILIAAEIPPDTIQQKVRTYFSGENTPEPHIFGDPKSFHIFLPDPAGQPRSHTCGLWGVTGTTNMHVDDTFLVSLTMGLVITNDSSLNLRVRGMPDLLPLKPGTVFRINHLKSHGTCTRDRKHTASGLLSFVSFEFSEDMEPSPKDYAKLITAQLNNHAAY